MRVPRKPPACPDCKHPKRDHVMWFDYVEGRQVVRCTVTSCQCKFGLAQPREQDGLAGLEGDLPLHARGAAQGHHY